MAQHLANLGIGWKRHDWGAGVSEHHLGSQYVTEYNPGLPGSETIPRNAVMNLSIRDTVHVGSGPMTAPRKL